MKVIKPYTKILSPHNHSDYVSMVHAIEAAGRTCYKSEKASGFKEQERFVKGIIVKGHESVIEHQFISVLFVCDRGVTHEIVRHRIASYSQESTRYCNYSQDRFDNEITVIHPVFFRDEGITGKYLLWTNAMTQAEKAYFNLLDLGATPQEARSVLPNSLKTEIVVTMNLREWRHFFGLRTARAAHPQMRELTIPLLNQFKEYFPIFFEDIHED